MIKTITVESVTSGHPDKLADLIADSILDECLKQDKDSRVACEVMLSDKNVILAGEITTKATVDYKQVATNVINTVGYNSEDLNIEVYIHEQSTDIANAVLRNNNKDIGAGDQGIVYGYAVNETYNFMPLATNFANSLVMRLEDCRKHNEIHGLMPDGKVQVTLEYENGIFKRIKTILVSAQHTKDTDVEQFRLDISAMIHQMFHFINFDTDKTELIINPSGRFVLGGFEADTGLTGRKLAVDTYGGIAHNGGGALSGKDATKVDRSGAYMARYLAKNIVAAGIADGCELSIAYAIGKPQPIDIDVSLFGKAVCDSDKVKQFIIDNIDLRPAAIMSNLELNQAIYAQTAVGGHFGIDDMPWEELNLISKIRKMLM